jgi:hypothetical protein
MSFIQKSDNVVVNVKLTTIGRKLLASGALTFKKWVIGDSEIDYTFASNTDFDLTESMILRPKDLNPNIKYPVLPTENASTQYNNIGTIVPIEVKVRNTAIERGLFSGNTTTGFTAKTDYNSVIQNKLKIDLTDVNGGTTIAVKQDTGFSLYSEPIIGDYLFIQWINPADSGSSYPEGVVYPNNPKPMLWYKIISKTGTISADTLTVTLDRELPNFNGDGFGKQVACIIYPAGDSINTFYGYNESTAYWNDNTLSFNSTCNVADNDVKVWNMNIVYSEELAGKQVGYETFGAFGSSAYTGFKNYLSLTFDKPTQKSLGIIHYTNNTINNYYGEELYQNTPILELPSIIWHKSTGNTIGLTLRCDSTIKTTITGQDAIDLNTTYYDLIDSNGYVVGKCFNNLKMFVIEDEELIASMSYKSNRNWSLPTLTNAGLTSGIPTTRPNIFTSVDQKLYVSYIFLNTGTDLLYNNQVSYGYTNALHCQNYIEYVPDVTSAGVLTNNQVVQFSLTDSELKFLANKDTFNGNGVTYNEFRLIYQLVNDKNDRPDPTAWKIYDYTPNLNTYSNWSTNCIPSSAFTGYIYTFDKNMFDAGSTYNLNDWLTISTTSQPDNLQFGDEVVFFGNVKTDIAATVYKTKFITTLPFNQFNTSQNPTWDDSGKSVYISEMGVYDDNNNLVAIGKLSYPFEKKSSQTRIIEASIDF